MKSVKLNSITLINFKGEKNRTFEFPNMQHFVFGKNAAGKSRLFDAFTWLFFGKDQFDRDNYQIFTIENGNILDRIDAEVSAELSIEGQTVSLRRVLRQKWIRKRGSETETFDGSTTDYYINDVLVKAGEYSDYIKSIIDMEIFRLVTNPSYFLSLPWKKQRAQLFSIAGTLTDEEIVAMRPEFSDLLEYLTGDKLAERIKSLSARKKKLSENQKEIKPKIEQTRKMMPEKIDFTPLEDELRIVNSKISDIDIALSDRNKLLDKRAKEVKDKRDSIESLEGQRRTMLSNLNSRNQKAVYASNSQRRELKEKIDSEQEKIDQIKRDVQKLYLEKADVNAEIRDIDSKLEILRKDWEKENETEFKDDSDLSCPIFHFACDSACAVAKYLENKEKSKEEFVKAKNKRLDELDERGLSLSKRKAELTEKANSLVSKAEGLSKSKGPIEDELKALKEEFQKTNEEKFIEIKPDRINSLTAEEILLYDSLTPKDLEEYKSLGELIEIHRSAINEIRREPEDDNSSIIAEKSNLVKKRDEIKTRLRDREDIQRAEQEVKRLEEEGKSIALQIANIEKEEFHIQEFTSIKIQELEDRVNRLFKIVRFELFSYTIDGGQSEACIATNYKGVPIEATNTAERVNAGIDIINKLCEFYNVSAPIFVDSRESVNELISTESQVINLVVSKDKELVIE